MAGETTFMDWARLNKPQPKVVENVTAEPKLLTATDLGLDDDLDQAPIVPGGSKPATTPITGEIKKLPPKPAVTTPDTSVVPPKQDGDNGGYQDAEAKMEQAVADTKAKTETKPLETNSGTIDQSLLDDMDKAVGIMKADGMTFGKIREQLKKMYGLESTIKLDPKQLDTYIEKFYSNRDMSEIADALTPQEMQITSEITILKALLESSPGVRSGARKEAELAVKAAERRLEMYRMSIATNQKRQSGVESFNKGIARIVEVASQARDKSSELAGTVTALPENTVKAVKEIESGVKDRVKRLDVAQAKLRNNLADTVDDQLKDTVGKIESTGLGFKSKILEARANIARIKADVMGVITQIRLISDEGAAMSELRRSEIAEKIAEEALVNNNPDAAGKAGEIAKQKLENSSKRLEALQRRTEELKQQRAVGTTQENELFRAAVQLRTEAENRKNNGKSLGWFRKWLVKAIDAK